MATNIKTLQFQNFCYTTFAVNGIKRQTPEWQIDFKHLPFFYSHSTV